MALADTKTIPVGIDKLDFSSPRLIHNRLPKFVSDRLDVVHIEVDQGFRSGVSLVLGKMEPNFSSLQENVQGHPVGEAMLTLDLEAEPCVPFRCFGTIRDAEDGYEHFVR